MVFRDPKEARRWGRVGAYTQHARNDARATTQKARDTFLKRFLREVDPSGTLPAEERERRAQSARRLYFSRLAQKRNASRRPRQSQQPPSASAAPLSPRSQTSEARPPRSRIERPPVDAPRTRLDALIDSWHLHLQAARKSPRTIRLYLLHMRTLKGYLVERGLPTDVARIARRHLEGYFAWSLGSCAPVTVVSRYAVARGFFNWLVKVERELDASPMVGIERPSVPEAPPPIITEDHVERMLRATDGKSFLDRRNHAILCILYDGGVRVGELEGMALADVDLRERLIRVTGKGDRTRYVPVGAVAARNLDRYLRAREGHRLAHRPWLWLSSHGGLRVGSIEKMIRDLARRLGLPRTYPHLFRHSWTDALLKRGGQEGDVMQLAGWTSRAMLGRYGSSQAAARARAAHRKLSPLDNL